MNNVWKLPIGDWSDDGHGKCDWFIIKSNFTVEQAREAYFKTVEESGVDIIKEIAYEYEDSNVSERITNLLPEFIQDLAADDIIGIWEWEDDGIYHVETSRDMAEIFLRFIKEYSPEEFEYEIINIPMLPFYGYDEKGRHIGHIGYGLFS